MGELAAEAAALEPLPDWVPDYLAAWGSRVGPDGERMQVQRAAAMVGVTPDAVRMLRQRSERFRLLEKVARHSGSAFTASYMEAGIKGLAFELFRSFRTLVQERNPQVVLQGMKWAMDRPDVTVSADVRGEMAFSDVTDDELEAIQRALSGETTGGGEAG